MKTTASQFESLRSALEEPTGGVVGLVDDLLQLCSEGDLAIDWKTDGIQIRSLADGTCEVIDRPPANSVFRAVLARLAALCNERTAGSVSPYGGEGELEIATGLPRSFRVTFTNTAEEQALELRPVR